MEPLCVRESGVSLALSSFLVLFSLWIDYWLLSLFFYMRLKQLSFLIIRISNITPTSTCHLHDWNTSLIALYMGLPTIPQIMSTVFFLKCESPRNFPLLKILEWMFMVLRHGLWHNSLCFGSCLPIELHYSLFPLSTPTPLSPHGLYCNCSACREHSVPSRLDHPTQTSLFPFTL